MLYVDQIIGDDNRTREQATSAGSPWKTLTRAMTELMDGDTIVMAAGTYSGGVTIERSSVSIRGLTGDPADVRIVPGASDDGFVVRGNNFSIQDLWIDDCRRGIAQARRLTGLQVRNVVVSRARRDGIYLSNDTGTRVVRSIITGTRRYGLYARRSNDLEVRESLIYAGQKTGIALSRCTVRLLLDTLYQHPKDALRGVKSAVTIRDSIIAQSGRYALSLGSPAATEVSFTSFWQNALLVRPASITFGAGTHIDTLDPTFLDPAGPDGLLGGLDWRDDGMSLSQLAAGNASQSPAVDAGSDLASALGVTSSTASNGMADTGIVDLGAHR